MPIIGKMMTSFITFYSEGIAISLCYSDGVDRREENNRRDDGIITPPLLHTSTKDRLSPSNTTQSMHLSPASTTKHQEDTTLSPSSVKKTLAVNSNCSDRHCTSLLTKVERQRYLRCEQLASRKAHVSPRDIPYKCAFRDGRGLDPVALVSLPGSGNTWVRSMLEKATGICTGSIYCDSPLRTGGFVGESVRDGSVIVVKTHTSDYQWKDDTEKRNKDDAYYGSAIMLIRNPFDALVAEWHRLEGLKKSGGKDLSHVDKAGKNKFGEQFCLKLHNISVAFQVKTKSGIPTSSITVQDGKRLY